MRLDRTGQGLDREGEEADAAPPAPGEPMRSVRLPMGFVVLAVVAVAVLLSLSWLLGRGAGADEARRDFHTSGQARVQTDPLRSNGAMPVTSDSATVEAAPAATENLTPTPPPLTDVVNSDPVPAGTVEIAAPDAAPQTALSDGDPRVPGLYYWVLATTTPAGATRTATFCRENGLDARVILGQNTRLARVIVLPGLKSDRLSDPTTRALADQIERVGRLWKQHDGHTSFEDKYTSLMKGP